jgi:hypothetical protein
VKEGTTVANIEVAAVEPIDLIRTMVPSLIHVARRRPRTKEAEA